MGHSKLPVTQKGDNHAARAHLQDLQATPTLVRARHAVGAHTCRVGPSAGAPDEYRSSLGNGRSPLARGEEDPGGLIRLPRTELGGRLEDLGARIGCSVAMVSPLERRGRMSDFDLLISAAKAVQIPTHVLAASLGLTSAPPH
ncbi:hypothetical protein GCM10010329_61480 [Streptomyces spiroverticillatus]|uniref:Uncharacterized protein n=1 Tax=Streptomyces finlayi TaxID=67296 RepID=A0A918X6F1_9ACTN|nr:hypothetical protein GCM10010329_61480 [Streptomyces spiroverticillatus]GHD15151.1 hypothetical protein GCM10010334_74970 [Streptomyces finlayi]